MLLLRERKWRIRKVIKIDMKMPKKCTECTFCQIAFDSELFENGEPYCCIEIESVESYMDDNTKPDWCPVLECD